MGWQELLTVLIVAAAAVVVARRAYRAIFLSGKSGCGTGCGTCSSQKRATILTIGPPSSDPPDSRP